MNFKIIVDSCCDMTSELKKRIGAIVISLNINIGEKHFVDDEFLDLKTFIDNMKDCKTKIGTSAPSPLKYQEAYEGEHVSFAVTLSEKLSSSYSSANLGKNMLTPENSENVHVFDSKSASAGEILVALKIKELIDKNFKKLDIIAHIENFINNMKTYCILDNIDNLLKNGRLNKVVGKLITMLNIKPVMGTDGNGNIALFSHARGEKQIIDKLTDTIKKSDKKTDGEKMVITHCENLSLAQKLMNSIKKNYNFKEILIVPMRGLSSVYANYKGIVMAF